MNAGKTVAACELVARLTQRGYRVGAAKLTGVAAVRDPFNMDDHGAIVTRTFHDVGLPSTAGMELNAWRMELGGCFCASTPTSVPQTPPSSVRTRTH